MRGPEILDLSVLIQREVQAALGTRMTLAKVVERNERGGGGRDLYDEWGMCLCLPANYLLSMISEADLRSRCGAKEFWMGRGGTSMPRSCSSSSAPKELFKLFRTSLAAEKQAQNWILRSVYI